MHKVHPPTLEAISYRMQIWKVPGNLPLKLTSITSLTFTLGIDKIECFLILMHIQECTYKLTFMELFTSHEKAMVLMNTSKLSTNINSLTYWFCGTIKIALKLRICIMSYNVHCHSPLNLSLSVPSPISPSLPLRFTVLGNKWHSVLQVAPATIQLH